MSFAQFSGEKMILAERQERIDFFIVSVKIKKGLLTDNIKKIRNSIDSNSYQFSLDIIIDYGVFSINLFTSTHNLHHNMDNVPTFRDDIRKNIV